MNMNSLVQLLVTCEALLRSIGEAFWADKLSTALQKSGKGLDGYVLEEIISWYGGMGSFNDLIISVHNDHNLDGQSEDKLNDQLNKIRAEIYQKAVSLKKFQ